MSVKLLASVFHRIWSSRWMNKSSHYFRAAYSVAKTAKPLRGRKREGSFGVSKQKRRLHRFVRVYTCQNATLLEITFHGSCRILQECYLVVLGPSLPQLTYLECMWTAKAPTRVDAHSSEPLQVTYGISTKLSSYWPTHHVVRIKLHWSRDMVLILNAPIATKVVCFLVCWNV